MTMISAIENGGFEARVDALQAEFGSILAARIMDAEAADFLWEARIKERYLGQHLDIGLNLDDEETELSRVAVLSSMAGRWHVATCLVDGEGMAGDLLWKRSFEDRGQAEATFDRAV